jgi:hypothetical protein
VGAGFLQRIQAKWKPVRVKKTRQIKKPEPRFDSIEAETALDAAGSVAPFAKSRMPSNRTAGAKASKAGISLE